MRESPRIRPAENRRFGIQYSGKLVASSKPDYGAVCPQVEFRAEAACSDFRYLVPLFPKNAGPDSTRISDFRFEPEIGNARAVRTGVFWEKGNEVSEIGAGGLSAKFDLRTYSAVVWLAACY